MKSRFIFTFLLRSILSGCRNIEPRYVSREVACFLTTDCTGRTSDDVFLNGHHLTHCGNMERVLDVEWYLFIGTCKTGRRDMWWDSREEWFRFSFFAFLFVEKNTHRTSIVISTTAEQFSLFARFWTEGCGRLKEGVGSSREERACKGDG